MQIVLSVLFGLAENHLEDSTTKELEACLKTLGVSIINEQGNLQIKNELKNDQIKKTHIIDASLSETTLHFLIAACCVFPGLKLLKEKEGLIKQQVQDLVDCLKQMGAEITYENEDGFLPITIGSESFQSGTIKINRTISSLYLSTLLMLLPFIKNGEIEVSGKQSSKKHIDITIQALREFGIAVKNVEYRKYSIHYREYSRTTTYEVESDVSNACYFFAIASLTDSTITIQNINENSLQSDIGFIDVLEKMGAKVSKKKNQITIKGEGGLQGVSVDMSSCPNQIEMTAVLAAFAEGKTFIKGIHTLLIKEMNRIVSIQYELTKMGIKTEVSTNQIVIYGGKPRPAVINTYGDHRMAMAFSIAGTKMAGIKIDAPQVVEKTFPTFWRKLVELGIQLK